MLLALGTLSVAAQMPARESQSLSELEKQLQAIDAELETLAHLSLRSDSGSIGYRSQSYYSDDHEEWIEIDLGSIQAFEEIVIAPVIRRDSRIEFKADGLPERLLIRAGLSDDQTGQLIATVTNILPRTAPIVIPVENTEAAWIRIEAPALTQRGLDGRYTFQLSEILVFHGEENIALHRPVKTSTASTGHSDAWNPRFLVDGHMPFIMDTARGEQTLALIALGAQPPSIMIDLQEPQRISRIHLHAVDQGTMVPQEHFSDFGLPRHLRIEGALRADFSDARPLLETRYKSAVEAGPIMMWRIPETTCRYVRITAPSAEFGLNIPPIHLGVLARLLRKEDITINQDSPLFRFGFAEIELFSNGRNIARNKPVIPINLPNKIQGDFSALTDGSNLYGDILPLREWMHQLARRHELEKERPLIAAEINRRLARQQTNLQRMYWVLGVLTLFIVGGMILARRIHLHHTKQIKKRIAADLHDEIGANLHAIGLFGDLAKMEVPESGNEQLAQNLDEIRNLTEMTSASTRYVTQMLDAECYHENLVLEMKHTAERFLADLDHVCTFAPEAELQHLSPRKRIDLYLFYKECLTNIIRHSGASKVKTDLGIQDRQLILTVEDNGVGLNGKPPPSIMRRAQLMHGKLSITQPSGGTCITLTLKIKKANG